MHWFLSSTLDETCTVSQWEKNYHTVSVKDFMSKKYYYLLSLMNGCIIIHETEPIYVPIVIFSTASCLILLWLENYAWFSSLPFLKFQVQHGIRSLISRCRKLYYQTCIAVSKNTYCMEKDLINLTHLHLLRAKTM